MRQGVRSAMLSSNILLGPGLSEQSAAVWNGSIRGREDDVVVFILKTKNKTLRHDLSDLSIPEIDNSQYLSINQIIRHVVFRDSSRGSEYSHLRSEIDFHQPGRMPRLWKWSSRSHGAGSDIDGFERFRINSFCDSHGLETRVAFIIRKASSSPESLLLHWLQVWLSSSMFQSR